MDENGFQIIRKLPETEQRHYHLVCSLDPQLNDPLQHLVALQKQDTQSLAMETSR